MAAQTKTRAQRKRPEPTQNGEGRREQNKREKRDRIVEASRELFQKHGYANTTVQQISKGANVAAGTLFLYAKSKEELLILVFRDEMMEVIESAYGEIDPDAPFLEQVSALFKRFIAYHARDVAIARELIREITFLTNRDRSSDLIAITQAIINKLAAFTERAAARRELDPRIDRHACSRTVCSRSITSSCKRGCRATSRANSSSATSRRCSRRWSTAVATASDDGTACSRNL